MKHSCRAGSGATGSPARRRDGHEVQGTRVILRGGHARGDDRSEACPFFCRARAPARATLRSRRLGRAPHFRALSGAVGRGCDSPMNGNVCATRQLQHGGVFRATCCASTWRGRRSRRAADSATRRRRAGRGRVDPGVDVEDERDPQGAQAQDSHRTTARDHGDEPDDGTGTRAPGDAATTEREDAGRPGRRTRSGPLPGRSKR